MSVSSTAGTELNNSLELQLESDNGHSPCSAETSSNPMDFELPRLESRLPLRQPPVVASVAEQICEQHRMPGWYTDKGRTVLPSAPQVVAILSLIEEVLFPCYRSAPCHSQADAQSVVRANLHRLYDSLHTQVERAIPFRWLGDYERAHGVAPVEDVAAETERVVDTFVSTIPEIRRRLMLDVEAAYRCDPAAHSYAEVILSYPGVRAITVHRIAHELYRLKVPLLPRMMSEHLHSVTGIDIHPGAHIGDSFFIDHGTGVVIGETTEIGTDVHLFQGVTLGARSFPVDDDGNTIKGAKRHPTIGNGVTVYSGATILGGDVMIGEHSVIGGNVWLTESVPPFSLVVQEHHKLVRVNQRTRGSLDGFEGAGI